MSTRREYTTALRYYIAGGGEAALMDAYSLGRLAVCEGMRLVDFAGMHLEVAAQEMAKLESADRRTAAQERAAEFFAEALCPFEMEASGAKEMNETLRRANIELDRASRLKSKFLAHMSHELRTPLNSVIGFAQLLVAGAAGELNQKQLRYANNILTSGSHQLSLVNDILDLSKIEAGQMLLAIEPVDVAAVIDECVEAMAPQSLEKRLLFDVAASRDAWAAADRRRLLQVVRNLMSNAVKFTPEGGTIALRSELRPGSVSVVVKDSGVGIPVEEQARIFEEFAQVESEARRQEQGTGLGLALARRLVEMMGGTIDLESTPGAGTTVTVALKRTKRVA